MRITKFKKSLLGLAVLLVVGTSCTKKPERYTITGFIGGEKEVDSVFVYKNENNQQIKLNGTNVVNGKFTLEGSVDTVRHIYFGNLEQDAFTTMILENDVYEVKLTNERIKVEGGNINTMILGYMNGEEYIALGEKNMELNMKAMDEEDEDVKADMIKEIRGVQNQMFDIEDKALYKVIDDANKPAEARLLALIYCQNFGHYGIQKRRDLLTDIEKNLESKYSKMIQGYRVTLDEIEKTRKMKATVGKGQSFKPIAGLGVDGKVLELKDYVSKNKYTLLEFWASWCGPCRAEIPVLKQAYKKYKSKGLEIFSFSIDDKEEDWRQALKEENPTWIQTIKQGKKGNEMMVSYAVDGIPASFLIDQEGKIVASNEELRGESLEELLKELLKK